MPRPATLPRLSQVLGVDPLEFLAAESAESLYLRALRVVRGLGLRQLAHAASSWSSTLGRWESRDPVRLPDAEAVRAPAGELDVDPTRVEEALVKARPLARVPRSEARRTGRTQVKVW